MSDTTKDAPTSEARQRYEKPAIVSEETFETQALGCTQAAVAGGGKTGNCGTPFRPGTTASS